MPFSLEKYHGGQGVSTLGTGPWYGLGAKAAGCGLSAAAASPPSDKYINNDVDLLWTSQ
jgi:hypothetical protein